MDIRDPRFIEKMMRQASDLDRQGRHQEADALQDNVRTIVSQFTSMTPQQTTQQENAGSATRGFLGKWVGKPIEDGAKFVGESFMDGLVNPIVGGAEAVGNFGKGLLNVGGPTKVTTPMGAAPQASPAAPTSPSMPTSVSAFLARGPWASNPSGFLQKCKEIATTKGKPALQSHLQQGQAPPDVMQWALSQV